MNFTQILLPFQHIIGMEEILLRPKFKVYNHLTGDFSQ